MTKHTCYIKVIYLPTDAQQNCFKRNIKIYLKSLTLRLLISYIYIYIYMEHLFLMFLDHTQRRTTVGRTPLDEWSARPEESYRLCCVVVCDLETSRICAIYIYIYDTSSLRVKCTFIFAHTLVMAFLPDDVFSNFFDGRDDRYFRIWFRVSRLQTLYHPL